MALILREITYWIGQDYWNRGFASEALKRFLHIEQNRPLFARSASDNSGSRRVLEKNGFVIIGEKLSYAPAREENIYETMFKLSS